MTRLKHVDSTLAGFTRKPRNGAGGPAKIKFSYYNEQGRKITDKETLERIRGLVIPPAWTEVWICPFPNGHLQATGKDKRGRKQYLYHPDWVKLRQVTKYENLLQFGKNLPRIRRQISRDLRKRVMEKEKVIAIALTVMEETLMRVGNNYYEKEYGSHGLTTLRNKHVKINGNKVSFRFRGKKGVIQELSSRSKQLARLLRKIRELPGQELFRYYDSEGLLKSLDSGDINDYILQCTQCDFTTKDYRTWAGSVYALTSIMAIPEENSTEAIEKNTVKIVREVAARLGNTPAVCRKYYIYPPLLEAQQRKKIWKALNRPGNLSGTTHMSREEKGLLRILKEV